MDFPPFPDNRNRTSTIEDISGNDVAYTIIDEIVQQQTGHPGKLLCLQLLDFGEGKLEVRLCYYIIGQKAGRQWQWFFGQSATMLPRQDLLDLVRQAEGRGWFER